MGYFYLAGMTAPMEECRELTYYDSERLHSGRSAGLCAMVAQGILWPASGAPAMAIRAQAAARRESG